MVALLLLLFLIATTFSSSSSQKDNNLEYSAQCSINGIERSCSIALFSVKSFDISGTIVIVNTSFCDPLSENLKPVSWRFVKGKSIALVKRGDCAFDIKTQNAERLGYHGLIIENSEKDLFPMGSSKDTFHSNIPVVMVSKGASFDCSQNENIGVLKKLSDRNRESNAGVNSEAIESAITWILGVAIVSPFLLDYFPSSWKPHIISITIVLVFFILKLCTFRVLMVTSDGEIIWNHQETDEKIFEALVNNVLADPFSYTLTQNQITTFNLSTENYSNKVFIHPPAFVYLSAFLHKYVGLPLPWVPIAFQCSTLLLIPILVSLSFSDLPISKRNQVASIAQIIFLFCPLAAFCSQKFWIDNGLLFGVTLSMTVHQYLSQSWISKRLAHWTWIFSGLCFGVFCLNMKITGLALLPSLLCWTVVSTFNFDKIPQCVQEWWDLLSTACYRSILLLLGCTLTYLPWLFHYHHNTNLWLPNAWPSKSMIERSKFLQQILSKPYYSYFLTLTTISPLHMVGIIVGVVCCFSLFTLWISGRFHLEEERNPCHALTGTWKSSLQLLSLWIWPMSFVLALTFLGALGSGFQNRFILPIVPATSILAAYAWVSLDSCYLPLWCILLCYAAFHVVYYGILFPPLFADLDMSLGEIIKNLLESYYSPPSSPHSSKEMLQFMRHFGLHR